jgi:thiamine-monophosphate kinase
MERARIARYFAPLAAGEAGSFQLSDDAAVLSIPAGKQLVITTDSVIESIHVLSGATPQQFAQKLMRRNLSDLAAMGATPWCYSLNLHTPRGLNEEWFALFATTLGGEQAQFGLTLIGGDSTSGQSPIHTTLTCYGLIDGTPLRRNGAQIGDDIYVSGSLGGASYALHLLQHHQPISDALAARYHRPEPRLQLGSMLRGIAHAALDISDGLLADLGQLCEASRCAARITRETLPLEATLATHINRDPSLWNHALAGGDDYELLFTAAPEQRARIESIASALQLPLTHIGNVTAGEGITLLDTHGNRLPITQTGYEHH